MAPRKPLTKEPRIDHYAREVAIEAATKVMAMEERFKGWIDELRNDLRPFKRQMDDLGIKVEEVKQAVTGDEWGRQEGLIKRVRRVEEQIIGTPEKPNEGLAARVSGIEIDLHGDDEARPGIGVRLKNIEETRDKMFRYAIIWVVLASLAGGGVGATGGDLAKDAATAAIHAIVGDIGKAAASPIVEGRR